jgi:AcrR family transcriptional regulator
MGSAQGPAARPLLGDPDRTARARIRDAAIARFASDGVAATSLKSIAADAGTSTPLVIHHYGSKEGLRVACDEYVVAAIRTIKHASVAAGRSLDPFPVIRDLQQGPPLLKYLSRTLADSSPQVAALIDELVDDAVAYMAEGIRSGLLKPTDHPREVAIVLTLWQLGALVLHEHAKRLLGVDLTGDPEGLMAWALPATEILTKGVIDERFYQTLRQGAPPDHTTKPRQTRTRP